MSRGKKLDLFIGSQIPEDSWSVESDTPAKKEQKILTPNKHQLYLKKEKRRGKVVTLVGEFFLSKDDANKLLKKVKKQLGCGGSFKNSFMEFQGELSKQVKELLQKESFRFK